MKNNKSVVSTEEAKKYFGTWENLEKHWAKVEKEIDEEIEKRYANMKCT